MSEQGINRDEMTFPDPVVCVSDLLWDEHWSSEQQLMSRLAIKGRVLYVDRTVSFLSFFTGSSDAPIGRQFSRFFQGGLRQVSENLTVLTPPPVLPFRFIKIVNVFNEWVRAGAIRRALRTLNAQSAVLWIYAPDAGRLIGCLGEKLSLYFCADDWGASDQWWNRSTDVRAREDELAAKVDFIIGTSNKLAEKWQQRYGKATALHNGADITAFHAARDSKLTIPEDLHAISGPRIGYVGFVDGRFDTGMFETAAHLHPEWSFVIVGPVSDRNVNLTALKTLPNVHFLGSRTREQLPAYLKGFAVCTIPYVRNELSDSIFPLKLFEYLGAGRPVVTTALPELKPYTQYIRIASSQEEFEQALAESLVNPLPPAGDDFLRENSWDAKADLMWNRIVHELTVRSPGAKVGSR